MLIKFIYFIKQINLQGPLLSTQTNTRQKLIFIGFPIPGIKQNKKKRKKKE